MTLLGSQQGACVIWATSAQRFPFRWKAMQCCHAGTLRLSPPPRVEGARGAGGVRGRALPQVAAAGGWHGGLEAGSWAWAPGPLVPLLGLPDVEPRPPSLERPRNTHQTSPGRQFASEFFETQVETVRPHSPSRAQREYWTEKPEERPLHWLCLGLRSRVGPGNLGFSVRPQLAESGALTPRSHSFPICVPAPSARGVGGPV